MSPGQPRVTIGIPTWNRSHLLAEALDSVLAQTMDDPEVIVFDDGSTDDTAEVMARYADPRISYVRNPRNLGHPDNVTQILTAGTAPFVGMLFDDDVMFPDHLERLVPLLEAHPRAAVAHSAYELWTKDGGRHPKLLPGMATDHPTEESAERFVTRLVKDPPRVWVASALVRRELVAELDFREIDEPATDVGFWMRAAMAGTIVYDPVPTACLRVTEGYSSENRFLAIDDGAYGPTFGTVRAYRLVNENFKKEHDLPWRFRVAMALANARNTHGLLQAVIRRRAPGLRPGRSVPSLLREAVAIDPSVIADPIFAYRLAVEGVTGARATR